MKKWIAGTVGLMALAAVMLFAQSDTRAILGMNQIPVCCNTSGGLKSYSTFTFDGTTFIAPAKKSPIIPTGATIAPTLAQCGSQINMGATGGTVVTLPVPPASGSCTFDFTITVSNTSASNEIETDGSSTFLLGSVEHSATGIAPLNFWANGTSIQALKMDGAHLGGLIGSVIKVSSISSTLWAISGTNLCTATCTTAFTATP